MLEINLFQQKTYLIDPKSSPDDQYLLNMLAQEEQNYANQITAPQKKSEYLRSRWAFHQITQCPEPLLNNTSGEVLWPNDYHGSIAHKTGWVALCVIKNNAKTRYGIDLENYEKLGEHLIEKLTNDNEQKLLQNLAQDQKFNLAYLLTIVFSFKEAIFKAHFPIGKIMFFFNDVEITNIDLKTQMVTAKFVKEQLKQCSKTEFVMGQYVDLYQQIGEPLIVTMCEFNLV